MILKRDIQYFVLENVALLKLYELRAKFTDMSLNIQPVKRGKWIIAGRDADGSSWILTIDGKLTRKI